jgi:hypothetical protein
MKTKRTRVPKVKAKLRFNNSRLRLRMSRVVVLQVRMDNSHWNLPERACLVNLISKEALESCRRSQLL